MTVDNDNVLSQKITVKRPSQSDLVFDQLYTYDTLNRITSAEEKTGTTVNWNQTYTFDRYGNRNFNHSLTTTLPKGCMDGSTPAVCEADKNIFDPDLNPANNRMATGQGWTYDAAGNVITDPEGRTFIYDAESKQTEVENSSSQTIGEYFFDGDGKRVKKYIPSTGEVTIFIYDAGAKLIGEYSTVVETEDPKVQYLTNDHLGSPRINTDQNGNVTSRTDYMPYGEEIIALGNRTINENYVSDDVRQGFTGYEKDDETGLDFAQARYYSQLLGRFSSADPLYLELRRLSDPQQMNLYTYTRNNPLRFVDSMGLDIEVIGETTDDYINRLQTNLSFKITRNSATRKVQIVDADGNALDKKALKALEKSLGSKSEKELFKAITDTKNHVVINTVKESGDVAFGRFDGNGQNTIDSSDLAILDNASDTGGFTAAHVVGHETLEAYHSARKKTTLANMRKSHDYANKFFSGIELIADQSGATFTVNSGSGTQTYTAATLPAQGSITHVSSVFNIQGTNRNIRIEKQFVTPIPRNAIPSSLPPNHIVDVRREP